jgi:hypothetical protein
MTRTAHDAGRGRRRWRWWFSWDVGGLGTAGAPTVVGPVVLLGTSEVSELQAPTMVGPVVLLGTSEVSELQAPAVVGVVVLLGRGRSRNCGGAGGGGGGGFAGTWMVSGLRGWVESWGDWD